MAAITTVYGDCETRATPGNIGHSLEASGRAEIWHTPAGPAPEHTLARPSIENRVRWRTVTSRPRRALPRCLYRGGRSRRRGAVGDFGQRSDTAPWFDRAATNWQLLSGYGNRHPSGTARRTGGRRGGGHEMKVRRQALPCFVVLRQPLRRLGAGAVLRPLPRASLRTLTGLLRNTSPGVLVTQKGRDALREGSRVADRKDDPGLARIDEVRDPSPVNRDDRQPARHRLADDVPEVLGVGGEDERVRRGVGSSKGLARRIRWRCGASPTRGSRATRYGSRPAALRARDDSRR